jgi:hypothetical protein
LFGAVFVSKWQEEKVIPYPPPGFYCMLCVRDLAMILFVFGLCRLLANFFAFFSRLFRVDKFPLKFGPLTEKRLGMLARPRAHLQGAKKRARLWSGRGVRRSAASVMHAHAQASTLSHHVCVLLCPHLLRAFAIAHAL